MYVQAGQQARHGHPLLGIEGASRLCRMRQQDQMSDPISEEPEWDEIAAILREARAKSRGYATYWEWGPDRSLAEVGVAKALADYLTQSEGCSWASVRAT